MDGLDIYMMKPVVNSGDLSEDKLSESVDKASSVNLRSEKHLYGSLLLAELDMPNGRALIASRKGIKSIIAEHHEYIKKKTQHFLCLRNCLRL